MSNKLPWFTHDHNARNDDFIFRAEDKFGPFGYSTYFKIVEILHEHGVRDSFKMTQARLCSELRCTRPKLRLYLNYGQTMGKIKFKWGLTEVEVQIKKFRERQNKLKFKHRANTAQIYSKHLLQEQGEGEIEGHMGTAVVSKPKRQFTSSADKPHIPPTIEEVRSYCLERKNDVDPQRWMDHYISNGWKVGKNKMKDWRAAVRTWEKDTPKKSEPIYHAPFPDKPLVPGVQLKGFR